MTSDEMIKAMYEAMMSFGGRLEKLEGRFGRLEERFDKLEGRFDRLENKVTVLTDDMKSVKKKLDKLDDEMNMLQVKQDINSRKLDDLTFRAASIEHTAKKEFRKLNDEVDTLIGVLEAKHILPQAQ